MKTKTSIFILALGLTQWGMSQDSALTNGSSAQAAPAQNNEATGLPTDNQTNFVMDGVTNNSSVPQTNLLDGYDGKGATNGSDLKGASDAREGNPYANYTNPNSVYINPNSTNVNPYANYTNPNSTYINPNSTNVNRYSTYTNPYWAGDNKTNSFKNTNGASGHYGTDGATNLNGNFGITNGSGSRTNRNPWWKLW